MCKIKKKQKKQKKNPVLPIENNAKSYDKIKHLHYNTVDGGGGGRGLSFPPHFGFGPSAVFGVLEVFYFYHIQTVL